MVSTPAVAVFFVVTPAGRLVAPTVLCFWWADCWWYPSGFLDESPEMLRAILPPGSSGWMQLEARNKSKWSNQCFSDKVGGKTSEERSISIYYCEEPCVYRRPSGCEVFLMQIPLSCLSCSPQLLELKEKRFFKFGCFKEDWLKSAAVWLNWIHMLGEGAWLVRTSCN